MADESTSMLSSLGGYGALAGAGIGLIGSIGKMFGTGKANRELEATKNRIRAMQINPEYARQAGLTQTQLQGRMAGASQAERNIYQQGANTQANINRAATDPMQAILGAGGIQGQTNQAFNQLAGQEQADYANRLARMMEAGMNKAQAEDALNMQKLQMETQLSGAQQENKQNVWGSLSNLGFAAADVGLNVMGNKGTATPPNATMGKMGMPSVNMGSAGQVMQGAYNPMAVQRMGGMGMPSVNTGMAGQVMPGAYSPMSTQRSNMAGVPSYLNPSTSPYTQTSVGNWWSQ